MKRKIEANKENNNGNDKQRKGPNSFSHLDNLDKNDAKENKDKSNKDECNWILQEAMPLPERQVQERR